jgi:hypothetical protein
MDDAADGRRIDGEIPGAGGRRGARVDEVGPACTRRASVAGDSTAMIRLRRRPARRSSRQAPVPAWGA